MTQASPHTPSGPLSGEAGFTQSITRGQWLVLGAAFLGQTGSIGCSYSGSGLPLVSGANQIMTMPTT
jgi:hypothetical protein